MKKSSFWNTLVGRLLMFSIIFCGAGTLIGIWISNRDELAPLTMVVISGNVLYLAFVILDRLYG